MVTEFFMSSIEYIEKYIHAEGVGAIIIIALIIFALAAFLSLITRSARLWYWKINQQMEVLNRIDKSLEILKEKNDSEPDLPKEEQPEVEPAEEKEVLTVQETEKNVETEEELRKLIKF